MNPACDLNAQNEAEVERAKEICLNLRPGEKMEWCRGYGFPTSGSSSATSQDASQQGDSFWRKAGRGALTVGEWAIAVPVIAVAVPLAVLAKLLGGSNQTPAQTQEQAAQAAAAWQQMTPEQRQEAIRLMQLQQQQEQQQQQQEMQNKELLFRAWQQMSQPPPAPKTTTCIPNVFGSVTCTTQ
jgi:hypothetical protein